MLIVASFVAFIILALGISLYLPLLGDKAPDLRNLGTAFSAGILLIYWAALLAPLELLLRYGVPLMLSFCLIRWLQRKHRGRSIRFSSLDWQGGALAAVTLAILATTVLSEPLTEWDARSIWFFHAKMIFYSGKVLDPIIWSDPSLSWAHPGYPKLNAILAALCTRFMGHWNEVDPKASLILLQIPMAWLAIGFARSLSRRLLLLSIVTLKVGHLLWDGHIDGLVAAYIALGALYGGRFAISRDRHDLHAAILAPGIATGLKDEGLVLALLVYAWTLAAAWWQQRTKLLTLLASSWVAILLALVPSLFWTVWKQLHLPSGFLTQGSPWHRLIERWHDGRSFGVIIDAINRPKEIRAIIPFVLALLIFTMVPRLRKSTQWLQLAPALGVIGSYTIVLCFVYLSTPADLIWHLNTSASRTVQPIFVCFALAIAGVLDEQQESFSGKCP